MIVPVHFSETIRRSRRSRREAAWSHMDPADRHSKEPDISFHGGDLDCGSALLLLIRQHMDPMERGQLLGSAPVET